MILECDFWRLRKSQAYSCTCLPASQLQIAAYPLQLYQSELNSPQVMFGS